MMGRGPEDNQHNNIREGNIFCLHNFLYGGTSCLVPTILTFPVYKTVFRQQVHGSVICQAVDQLRKEGVLKLYRGVVPPLLMRTLNGTLLFGLYDSFLQLLSSSNIPHSALPALAGLGTGVVEALVFTPFERVQNVLQHAGNDRSLPNLKNVLARLGSEKLGTGYYRAFTPILARNALGSGIYFSLNNPISAALKDKGLPPVASSFLSGTVTSMLISLSLYPLSVLSANMQAVVGGEVAGVGVRGSWKALWKGRLKRRLHLLYRGGSLVILRSCISWGITTAIYDQLRNRSIH